MLLVTLGKQMSWAHLARFELRVLFVTVLIIAIWWGFNPFSPWLAEIGILVILFGGFAFLIFANRMLFGGWLAFFFSCWLIAVSGLVTWGMFSARHTIIPQMQTYRLTSNMPVSLDYYRKGSDTIFATITNESEDWLRWAVVRCDLFRDDGTRIDKRFSYALANGLIGNGESYENRVVPDHRIRQFRADASRTRCEVESAEFMERPAFPVEIEIGYDRRHFRSVFTIHNGGDVAITDVLLQCRSQDGRNHQVRTIGRWEADPRQSPRVPAGGSAEVIATSAAQSNWLACSVVSAVPA